MLLQFLVLFTDRESDTGYRQLWAVSLTTLGLVSSEASHHSTDDTALFSNAYTAVTSGCVLSCLHIIPIY